MVDEKRKEVAFNIGTFQAWYVGLIYRKVFNAYTSGNLNEWYWNVSCLREILYSELEDNENKTLDEHEEEININLKKISLSKNKKQYSDYKSDAFKSILKYQRFIMQLFRKAGYLPSKKDRTKLQF